MVQYIDKDAVIEEIEKKRNAALTRQRNLEAIGQVTVLNETLARELNRIISFINTLEVKDVDLEKAIKDYIFALPHAKTGIPHGWKYSWSEEEVMKIAKHFFELKLKAQKEE